MGPMLVTKAMLPLLRKTRGRIINVTSAAARNPVPCFAIYSSSKAGLEAMSDALRLELFKFGVDVCMLEPPNSPEKTPLCSRQSKYHQEMRAAITQENERVFGEYFRKCSKFICSLFPHPANNGSADETFLQCFGAALTERNPDFIYSANKSGSLVENLREPFLKMLLPRCYYDEMRRSRVPLPKFEEC